MKLAFILNTLEIGGIGSVASILANNIVNLTNCDLHLILLHNEDRFFEVDNRIKVIENQTNRNKNSKLVYSIKTARFLRKIVKKERYDKIVVHGEWITTFVYFSLFGTCKNSIYFYDHSSPIRGGQHPSELLMKFAYKRANGILVLSQKAKEIIFHKTGNKNIVVIDNIVNLPSDSKVEKSRTNGLYLGRLSKEKGPDILLKAISKLKNKDCKFIFVGDGVIRKDLEILSVSLGIQTRVEFVGRQKPLNYLNHASFFLLPSHTENFPLSLIEAMAMGLPVIMTDCISWRGQDQFVVHMQNGIIVPKNNPEALADAIDYLIDNDDIRTKMGLEALKIRERFDQNKIVENFLRVIKYHEA